MHRLVQQQLHILSYIIGNVLTVRTRCYGDSERCWMVPEAVRTLYTVLMLYLNTNKTIFPYGSMPKLQQRAIEKSDVAPHHPLHCHTL